MLPELPECKLHIELLAKTGSWDDNKTAMKTTVLRPIRTTTPPLSSHVELSLQHRTFCRQ